MHDVRDRVVIMLLFDQIVREEHVAWAWHEARQGAAGDTLWRTLLRHPGLDHDAIYAEAARVYAFQPARITRPEALSLIRDVAEALDASTLAQMVSLRLVPYAVTDGTLHFATHDPTRPEVQRFLEQLRLERFELQYVPEQLADDLLAAALPHTARPSGAGLAPESPWGSSIGRAAGEEPAGTRPPPAPSPPREDRAVDAELDHLKLVDVLEETLVALVDRGSTEACFFPGAERTIDVFLRLEGRLQRTLTEPRLRIEAFLAFILDDVIKVPSDRRTGIAEVFIQRWIRETLCRFRVVAKPMANGAGTASPECVVVTLEERREVMNEYKRFGPPRR